MINRLFQLAVALFLVFSTIACGKGDDAEPVQKEVPAASPEPIPPRKVATPTVIVPDDQIQAKVIELLSDQTRKPVNAIKPTTHLHNDLKLDNEENVLLVMQLEDAFGFAIPNEDAQRLSTVAAITDYIRFRRSSK